MPDLHANDAVAHPPISYSIIVPAYNEADFLPRTLNALHEAMDQIAEEKNQYGEVIVVDNNSSDDTATVAERHALAEERLRVVFEPVNQISKSRNAGAAAATSNHLIFIDADTSVSAKVISGALNALSSGAVGGGARVEIDIAHRGGEFATGLWNKFAGFAKYAAGCFLFCRKEAFDAVGGFSEKVYASEEIWLTRALKKWGKSRQLSFVVLELSVVTSARKLEWLSTFAMIKQMAVIMFFPFALKHKRFCSAWYQRPDKQVASKSL